MSYANFKPTIWSKQIQFDLEKFMVFKDLCNTKFQGEAGEGKRVKIIGSSRPAVTKYTPGSDITAREVVPDSSIYLDIDQYDSVNYGVDDVDAAQANVDIMKSLMGEQSVAFAESADTYIAKLIAGGSNLVTKGTAVTTAALAKTAIDEAFVKLWDAGVPVSAETYIVVTPWFYNLFKDKLTDLYTNNVELLRKGIVGQYNGAMVKMSNNVHNDGTYDNLCIAAKNAVSFANGINKLEAYRPEKSFEDAIKGLHTYGAKIVRPKEIVTLQVKKS
jgi:hypothetical protein